MKMCGFYEFREYRDNLPKQDLYTAPLGREYATQKENVYSPVLIYEGLYGCYEFQYKMAQRVGGKILNAACASDPGGLGNLGAVNLDVQSYEEHTKTDFSKAQNFVHGTVFDIPFADETFDCVVLGEFIEHCIPDAAKKAILECRRVLKPDGVLILTFPMEYHPPKPEGDPEYAPGVTHRHRTWWTLDMQTALMRETRMTEIGRAILFYMDIFPLGGWGLVWRKP